MASAERTTAVNDRRRRERGVPPRSGTREAVSRDERAAAARARVSADKKRGVTTADWIVQLAAER
jgi:hypothetical protein